MLNDETLRTDYETDYGVDDRDTDSSYVPSGETSSSSEEDQHEEVDKFIKTKSRKSFSKELVPYGSYAFPSEIYRNGKETTDNMDLIDRQENGGIEDGDVEIADFPRIISVRGSCNTHFENDSPKQPFEIPQILSTSTDKILRSYSKWNDVEYPFVCNICDKLFKFERTVKRHMSTHLSFKEFECPICGKMFRRKCQLTVHTRIHSKDRPHKCDICGRAFREKGHLKTHGKTHTGEKRFVCEICDRPFATKKLLERHQMCHLKAKPFTCKYCDKKFSRKCSMRDHVRGHLNIVPKNFECCFCGKTFTHNTHLKKHMVVHTGKSPHYCDICDIHFHWTGSLYRHMKRTHSVIWSQGEITDAWPVSSNFNSRSKKGNSASNEEQREEPHNEEEGVVSLLGQTSSESGLDQSV